jgi:hypothetical protein
MASREKRKIHESLLAAGEALEEGRSHMHQ